MLGDLSYKRPHRLECVNPGRSCQDGLNPRTQLALAGELPISVETHTHFRDQKQRALCLGAYGEVSVLSIRWPGNMFQYPVDARRLRRF